MKIPSFIYLIVLLSSSPLITSCGGDEKQPDYEEGKTLARNAAVMMNAVTGYAPKKIGNHTNLFTNETAVQTQAIYQEGLAQLEESPVSNHLITALASTYPYYEFIKNAHSVFAVENYPGKLGEAFPDGTSVDPNTGLSVTFSSIEESVGNYTFTFDVSGTLNICSLIGGEGEHCQMTIDMSYVLDVTGLGVGTTLSNPNAFIYENEQFHTKFSGTISNSNYQLELSEGNISINGSVHNKLELQLIPSQNSMVDEIVLEIPKSHIYGKATFLPFGNDDLEIGIPFYMEFTKWHMTFLDNLFSAPAGSSNTQILDIFSLSRISVTSGIEFTRKNGDQAFVNFQIKSDLESFGIIQPISGLCSDYLQCVNWLFSFPINYFDLDDSTVTPELEFGTTFTFNVEGQKSSGHNTYRRTDENQHNWELSTDYEGQKYTGIIEKSQTLANKSLNFTNSAGAEISITFNEDGTIEQASIFDAEGLSLGQIVSVGNDLVVQFEDGDNINLGQ